MITEIYVVCVKETEHVLAALVRTAEPPGTSELEIDELTKPALLVRGWVGTPTPTEELLFHVLPEQLSAKVAEVNDGVRTVQGNPWGFRFDGELKELSEHGFAAATNLVANEVRVRLTAPAVTEDTPVWVQIEGGTIPEGDPLNLTGSIPAVVATPPPDGLQVDIPINPSLPPGAYRALILVKDRPLFFDKSVIS